MQLTRMHQSQTFPKHHPTKPRQTFTISTISQLFSYTIFCCHFFVTSSAKLMEMQHFNVLIFHYCITAICGSGMASTDLQSVNQCSFARLRDYQVLQSILPILVISHVSSVYSVSLSRFFGYHGMLHFVAAQEYCSNVLSACWHNCKKPTKKSSENILNDRCLLINGRLRAAFRFAQLNDFILMNYKESLGVVKCFLSQIKLCWFLHQREQRSDQRFQIVNIIVINVNIKYKIFKPC